MEKADDDTNDLHHASTLGTLRLRHEGTNQIILVPTPSDDPNDPLNWSRPYKYYIALLVCFAMFIGCFVVSGPVVQIIPIAQEFVDENPAHLEHSITKVSYFFSTCALLQGAGNFLWIPLINKWGRRPVYILSFIIALGSCIWAVLTHSYGSELAARIILGFSIGASECLAPLTITEIFFLHERGKVIALYVFSLLSGFSGGIVLSGLITINLSWRYIYWVAIAFLGLILILVIFTFPETGFDRTNMPSRLSVVEMESQEQAKNPSSGRFSNSQSKYEKLERLKIFSGVYTREPLLKMMIRPALALMLPSVLWATVAMGLNVGFFVLITIDYAQAFLVTYGFVPWQSSLCWISGVLGGMVGIILGGKCSDTVADILTKRNGGIREAEMRLPVLVIPGVLGPLSLVLYGASIEYKWHWMCPTLMIGLLNLSLVISSTITMVFIVDSYRPIAGETIVTKMGFKAIFGFILSFYSNPWINNMGYIKAFGLMAAIYLGVFLFGIPMFFWGKRIRIRSISWRIMRYLKWHEDRETGE